MVGRAAAAEHLVRLLGWRSTFHRHARQHRITQLSESADAFDALAAVLHADERRDPAHYRQQVGESVGNLRTCAEAAYDEIQRRRNR
ncbi:hypothetical protein [Streptomyces sp. NPDC091215]|uniref:hypothetical protein n=1 Tax=Streptomyces sp. NPDC091215 TaxID=3155192 RepID=UPI00342D1BC3